MFAPMPRLIRSLTNHKWEAAEIKLANEPIGTKILVQAQALPIDQPLFIHRHWLIRTESGFSNKYEKIPIIPPF